MTRVRMLAHANVAGDHREPGDLVLVDAETAELMASIGVATLVEDRVERAVRAVPEVAARTSSSTRSRVRTGRPRASGE